MLFFVGYFLVILPAAVLVADLALDDRPATIDARTAVSAVHAADPTTIASVFAVVVAPSADAQGSILNAPYEGESITYRIDYAARAANGTTVQCRGNLTLRRVDTPRGSRAPVSARITGTCAA